MYLLVFNPYLKEITAKIKEHVIISDIRSGTYVTSFDVKAPDNLPFHLTNEELAESLKAIICEGSYHKEFSRLSVGDNRIICLISGGAREIFISQI